MIRHTLVVIGATLPAIIPQSASAQYGFADGGFDTQGASVTTYCYFPSCPAGAWTGGTGLIHTGNPSWNSAVAPSPSTMAFIQTNGKITQTFTATATARVRLTWLEADRVNFGGQTYIVSVNGVAVGTYTSSVKTFQVRVSDAFNLVSGTSYTISFAGQSPTVDRSSIIDSVRLVSAGSTTSYQYDALGRLVGTTNTGGVNGGVASTYSFDDASNRKKVTVSGAPQ